MTYVVWNWLSQNVGHSYNLVIGSADGYEVEVLKEVLSDNSVFDFSLLPLWEMQNSLSCEVFWDDQKWELV